MQRGYCLQDNHILENRLSFHHNATCGFWVCLIFVERAGERMYKAHYGKHTITSLIATRCCLTHPYFVNLQFL
jgi:hypothetical protein